MDNPSSLTFFLFCFCWVALIAGAVLGYIIGIRMARNRERHGTDFHRFLIMLEVVMQLLVDQAGFYIVAHLYLQNVDHFLLYFGNQYRESRFYPAVQITTHPVGRCQINIFLAVIIEIPDTGMFQEHIDNPGDPDIGTVRLSGNQTTDAPNWLFMNI